MGRVLSGFTSVGDAKLLLDYGGDCGQFIPKFLSLSEKFVFDLSDSKAVDGVTKLNSIEGRKFDFIMCCHVLEHTNQPFEELSGLKNT